MKGRTTPNLGWGLGTLAIQRTMIGPFAMAMVVFMGNDEKAIFWELAWLEGMWPKNIAPKIFEIAKKRNARCELRWIMFFWVGQINTRDMVFRLSMSLNSPSFSK
jgi:hypothetical protein